VPETRSSGKLSHLADYHAVVTYTCINSYYSDAIPDSQKSTSQSLQDKASRGKDDASNESMLDKAKGAMGMQK